jgi:hypothetical protein
MIYTKNTESEGGGQIRHISIIVINKILDTSDSSIH